METKKRGRKVLPPVTVKLSCEACLKEFEKTFDKPHKAVHNKPSTCSAHCARFVASLSTIANFIRQREASS